MKTRHLLSLATLILLTGASIAAAQTAPALTWGAHDIHNQGIAIPSAKTTLLVFLRPGQSQSSDAIALLAPILKDRDIQVVGIVSGDDSATRAAQLEKTGWKYSAVADDNYDASGKFSVRVWPTLVLVSTKGEEIARIPGLPTSLPTDLSAYLDFAAGKIDKAGLDKALANRDVVTDSEDQKAARHAEVAQRLAQQGMTTQAAAEVTKALELKPSSGTLLASLARTQLILGDFKSADTLLERLKPTDIPPHELGTLKGWSAIQAGRWPEAKSQLLEATKLNPNPAEPLYLLGRVYDHEADPTKAAEAYRKAFEHTPEGKTMGAASGN